MEAENQKPAEQPEVVTEVTGPVAVMPADFSFRKYAWKQFKKNKPAYISFYVLLFLVAIAIFAPVIANERPLYLKYHGQTFYPAFTFKTNYIFTNPKGEQENL